MGKLFFNILATFAEFEVDLIRMRTRVGMAVASAQGKLKGRQPKLSAGSQLRPPRSSAGRFKCPGTTAGWRPFTAFRRRWDMAVAGERSG